jgi:Glycosyltransferase like family 2
MKMPLEYVLPLRWTDDSGLDGLVAYLRWLAGLVDVTVVDGSGPAGYRRHAAAVAGLARHRPPDEDLAFANGKVNGVVTGVRVARHEHVVIADDDVRYDESGLRRIARLLADHDVVRPQNYFHPLPWHARWDTARSLVNRAVGVDYPGTLGVRRSTFERMGGYDGDVLFENLELIRTVRARGGVEARPLDLYVRRLPPEPGRFWNQRVRQAYDDLAQPLRLAVFLAVLPAAVVAAVAGGARTLAAVTALGALAAGGLAERGRRRAGGRRVFPASATLLAPLWVAERAVCVWLAVGARIGRGGVLYAGRRLRRAAHSERWLRENPLPGLASARRPEADELVRAVAERPDPGSAAPA